MKSCELISLSCCAVVQTLLYRWGFLFVVVHVLSVLCAVDFLLVEYYIFHFLCCRGRVVRRAMERGVGWRLSRTNHMKMAPGGRDSTPIRSTTWAATYQVSVSVIVTGSG